MEKSTAVKVIGSVGALALVFGSYTFFKKTNQKYNKWVENINEIKDLLETKLINNSVLKPWN